MIPILALLSLTAAVWASPYQTISITSNDNATNQDFRLPTTTIPSKYYLEIDLPKEAFEKGNTFTGFVHIQLNVTKPTNKLFLHSGVDILNVTLSDPIGKTNPVLHTNVNTTTEILMILLKYDLSTCMHYNLYIHYKGKITNDSIEGFSRVEYGNGPNKEKMFVTQFQPTAARSAFPCFDEPSFKATFNLRMNYPEGYTALSNTPERETRFRNGTKTTTFLETPRMSTYLVAFSVSKVTCTKSKTENTNVPMEICSRPIFNQQRSLALDYGKKVLDVMSAWTDYNYSSGTYKMDQFVVPGLNGLAMENWGFVTYSEYLVLFSEEDTSNELKQGAIELVAHEFSHQWFGNLVTTHWWNTLFLNEGLATYFQYFLFDLLGLQQFEMDKQFSVKIQQTAFSEDSSNDSSTLTSNALTSVEIEEKFGTITYEKGGSIFKMIANVIGPENFQEGLGKYLMRNAFQSVTPEKLWDSLSSTLKGGYLLPDLSFTEFVDNWIKKPGFPVISVKSNESDVILLQKQFLYHGESNTQWYVPIRYITSNNDTGLVWLKPNTSVTIKNVVANNDWIIVNHNSQGYYRVKYDNILLRRISSVLRSKPNLISDVNRAQIVDDLFNLAAAGQIRYFNLFQNIEFLKNETSYYPWYAALKGFNDITSLFQDKSEIVQHLNKIFLKLADSVSTNISTTEWKSLDHVSGLKLPAVWTAACKAGQESCIRN